MRYWLTLEFPTTAGLPPALMVLRAAADRLAGQLRGGAWLRQYSPLLGHLDLAVTPDVAGSDWELRRTARRMQGEVLTAQVGMPAEWAAEPADGPLMLRSATRLLGLLGLLGRELEIGPPMLRATVPAATSDDWSPFGPPPEADWDGVEKAIASGGALVQVGRADDDPAVTAAATELAQAFGLDARPVVVDGKVVLWS